ncbi:aldo/keto reductase [Oceanirhabdus seepicola]|uniref:Aldo/keto reductase n=1 Tax=Oceanirhabdus seepicola TaxID=2828781 RepID=A0A9J6P3Y6_9CLOT|nr:aldo/keto reductase [Oceanirhabdus seepicola]MCM1991490.1 aldo/keto reductase [Oceanirhabdus seepicola]
MIKGCATVKGTKGYFDKRNIQRDKLRNSGEFYTLPVAVGTHLGDFSEEHSMLFQECIEHALRKKVNFIDTAVNYRGMKSERDIGKVLDKLINKEKVLKREEVVISTKAGMLPGDIDIPLKPLDYLDEIFIKNGLLKKEDVNIIDGYRCSLNPNLYEYCIEQSKKNMGIETIDILYVHEPGISREVLGEEKFYDGIKEVFAALEEQVKKGNIRNYGMATWWCFREGTKGARYISLNKVYDIAKEVGGQNHHFRFIQLPYNKVMREATTLKNQEVDGEKITTIELAQRLGVKVTVSAPLNQFEFEKEKFTGSELVKYVIDTEGIYAAMIGTKRKEHLDDNIKGIIEEIRK